MMMRRRRESLTAATTLLVLAVVGVGGLRATRAQTPQPPQLPQKPPVFGARIDTVSVDVVVTDRKGRPVTDLTAADFEITENRKPQTIDSFKLIQIDDTVDVDPARNREIRSLSDQARELMRDDVRVIVIYLDDYHTRLGNSMAIRERLASFVRGLHPRDLVAVMTPLMSTSALTFSRNHDATARQIMAFQGRKYHYTPMHPAEEVYQYLTVQQIEHLRNQVVTTGLEGLCVYLGSVRDGRKSVLYVSEGLLSRVPDGTATSGLYGGIGGSMTPPQTIQEQMVASGAATAGQQASQLTLLDLLRDIFLAASRSNTSFYPMDPRGLAASEFSVADQVGLSEDRDALTESTDVLRVLASNTDGRAIVNSNNPQPALEQMLRDSSAYYLLGYTSTEAPRDGKFHPIRVTVRRNDVDVRSRSGYWAYTDEDVAKAARPSFTRPADVEKAFDAIADPPGSVIRSWWTSDRASDGRTAMTVVWDAVRPTGTDVPAAVVVTASTSSGALVHRGRMVPETDATGRVAGRVTFVSPPGPLLLKLVAENSDGDRIDVHDREVNVPDYASADAVVTPLELFRARSARDILQLKASPNPLPVTTRQFMRTERLLVRFRVYLPGGAAPTPQLRLLNRNGDVMSVVATTIDPVRGIEGEVALGAVPPGEYLLEAAASPEVGSPRMLVAFRVAG